MVLDISSLMGCLMMAVVLGAQTGFCGKKGEEPTLPQQQLSSLRTQVGLLNREAMVRMADDWAKTWEVRDGLPELRAFAARLDQRKREALAALAKSDSAPARNLLARHRRLVTRHPLLRDIKFLALRHQLGQKWARKERHPAAPFFSCYNGLDVNPKLKTQIVELSDFTGPTGQMVARCSMPGNGSIHAVDLNWDGKRVVFSGVPEGTNVWRLFESRLDGQPPKPLLPDSFIHEADDCCWLPDGKVIFTSDAAEQGLPCESGRWRMTNMYRLDPVSQKIQRLTYDQDSNWYPSVLNDGRVLYVRWEYCDIPHYFSRMVMTMRPDGTRQMNFYGSNGYWPNHYGNPLAIPGDNGKFVTIATGHHTPKSGKIVLFDAALARKEAAGAVQLIPGWGKPVTDIVRDGLYADDFPTALQPFPLGTSPKDGAGRYFLVSMKPCRDSLWGIYLVDVFDNITLLREEEGCAYTEPIARQVRPVPPVLPDQRREDVATSTMYVGDIYNGEGLRGVPRGTVKSVRLFAYHYAYNHTGSHDGVGMESSWDMKYVLGTVPVRKDGSLFFIAPVNTPISIQPLDSEGRAIQLMRSWTVGMPGEHVSCLGCHENANSLERAPALRGAPDRITPPEGRSRYRSWSFLREIQPILAKRCVGCHNQDPDPAVAAQKPSEDRGILFFTQMEGYPFLSGTKPNFADIRPMAISYGKPDSTEMSINAAGAFAKSYYYLQRYVRRPGPESDIHLLNPGEYCANTSPLIQMLKAGHHGVELTDEEWRRLYTWIDLNAAFWGTWADSIQWWTYTVNRHWGMRRGKATPDEQMAAMKRSFERRRYAESRYQGWWKPDATPELDRYGYDDAEKDLKKIAFVPPRNKASAAIPKTVSLPVAREPGRALTLELPGGGLTFRRISPDLLMSQTELPLRNYLPFAPGHDNGFVDQPGKDHSSGGIPVTQENFPVIRVSFQEAQAYCRWLSERIGQKVRLPTEAEWEHAARAGRKGKNFWGEDWKLVGKEANLADKSFSRLIARQGFNYHMRDRRVEDHAMVLDRVNSSRKGNAFGLQDMIGNAEEWAVGPANEPIARGGAFDTIPAWATFGHRIEGYYPWQRIYNVGIRLVIEEKE